MLFAVKHDVPALAARVVAWLWLGAGLHVRLSLDATQPIINCRSDNLASRFFEPAGLQIQLPEHFPADSHRDLHVLDPSRWTSNLFVFFLVVSHRLKCITRIIEVKGGFRLLVVGLCDTFIVWTTATHNKRKQK